MSQVLTEPAGTRTNLTSSAMNSLASATYVSCGTIDVSAIDPDDVVVEVEATPGTVSSDKGVYVFAKVSFDNTNFSSGPESSTSTTDEPNLYYLGFLPCNTNSTLQRRAFSLLQALGFVPPYTKIITKNATGAALASSGHAVNYTTYTGLST
jgi:hypothetical protein